MAESANSVRTMGRVETPGRVKQQQETTDLPMETVTWLVEAGIPALIAEQAAHRLWSRERMARLCAGRRWK